jgi:hypothetical protein
MRVPIRADGSRSRGRQHPSVRTRLPVHEDDNTRPRGWGDSSARQGPHGWGGISRELHKGSSNTPFSLPSSPLPGELTVSTTLYGLGCDKGVLLCLYLLLLGGQLWFLLHCEANFKVLAAEAIMTRTTLSDWIPWYVEEPDNNNNNMLHKVKCRICGDNFTKKNSSMLSHLGYIRNTSERDNNVRLCKNMKPDVACAFCKYSGVAPAPPEPAESQHLQGSVQSEEPICQGTPNSTMQESCGASQNLPPVVRAIWTSFATAPQLPASTGPSSARSRQ